MAHRILHHDQELGNRKSEHGTHEEVLEKQLSSDQMLGGGSVKPFSNRKRRNSSFWKHIESTVMCLKKAEAKLFPQTGF